MEPIYIILGAVTSAILLMLALKVINYFSSSTKKTFKYNGKIYTDASVDNYRKKRILDDDGNEVLVSLALFEIIHIDSARSIESGIDQVSSPSYGSGSRGFSSGFGGGSYSGGGSSESWSDSSDSGSSYDSGFDSSSSID